MMLRSNSPAVNRSFGGKAGGVWHLPNHVDQPAREIDADRRSFTFVDRRDGLANDTRQMKPDAIGRFCRPQVAADGLEAVAESAQLRIERLSDEYFVESSVECGHPSRVYWFTVASRRPSGHTEASP